MQSSEEARRAAVKSSEACDMGNEQRRTHDVVSPIFTVAGEVQLSSLWWRAGNEEGVGSGGATRPERLVQWWPTGR